MDFKALALASTLGGTVLLSGLTYTGTIKLSDIKNMGFGWADKVETSVNETKDMLAKFNVFKTDVTALLNEKIAKINSLNSKIAELNQQVSGGKGNLEQANNEIARLNEQLEQANKEIDDLKNEYGLKDAEVQQAFAQMETDASMDTTLALDTQNEDTVIPEDTTTPEQPTAPDYSAQETQIENDIVAQTGLTDATVTIANNQLVLTSTDTRLGNMSYTTLKPIIDNVLAPKTVSYVSGSQTSTSITFNIN